MDYDRLSRELIRALRGERSQRALGRRLRFTSNVVYAWESGQRHPTASAFFKVARSVGLDVGPRLQQALWGSERAGLTTARLVTPEGVAALVRELVHEQPASAVARTLGIDRMTVARWLRGRSEPRLPELLELIETSALRLLDVLELFTDPASLPSVRRRYRVLRAQRALAFELPFSHAVLRALELRGSRRSPSGDASFIAERIGISRAQAEAMLQALISAGQVRLRGGRYVVGDVMTVDTRIDAAHDLSLKRHWAQVALERIDATRLRGELLASYNLFAASDAASERIRQLHVEYYEAVRRIVASDRDPTRVLLLNIQLVPLDA